MNGLSKMITTLGDILHRRVFFLVVLSYLLAGLLPGPGLAIKNASIPIWTTSHGALKASMPALLLASLLLCAGLRVRSEQVRAILRRPTMLLTALLANISVPVAFLMVLIPVLGLWHNHEEVATIAIGLALVASMPVAGSSTGWAQHVGGDMALSLGLVLASTLVSPFSAPVTLGLLGSVSPASAATDLQVVANGQVGDFLLAWVLVPSLLGIIIRRLLPDRLTAALDRLLKPAATLILLALCYINAAACLPQVLHNPDWDYLGTLALIVLGMCTVTFSTGFLLGKFLGADIRQRAALVYGLGMNNNGTGLVLASVALSARPAVMLPIIVYNLSQHLVAGCVGGRTVRQSGL